MQKEINNSGLNISETFYSVQGEGITTGIPSFFIRLKGCNLSCGIGASQLSSLRKKLISGEVTADVDSLEKESKLYLEGKATWFCDSVGVWLLGEKKPFDYLFDIWINEGILEEILDGTIHLIWTGGEPTLPQHQQDIVDFLNYLYSLYPFAHVFNEIETNGTLYIEDELWSHLNQINCSVKLANSGMSLKKRFNQEALDRIIEHPLGYLKFVVSTEQDLLEILNDSYYSKLPKSKIVIMPGLEKQEDYHERTQFILEMAKKYKVRGLTRLHISAWDKAVGV